MNSKPSPGDIIPLFFCSLSARGCLQSSARPLSLKTLLLDREFPSRFQVPLRWEGVCSLCITMSSPRGAPRLRMLTAGVVWPSGFTFHVKATTQVNLLLSLNAVRPSPLLLFVQNGGQTNWVCICLDLLNIYWLRALEVS